MMHHFRASPDLDQDAISRALRSSELDILHLDSLEDLRPDCKSVLLATADSGYSAIQLVADARALAPRAAIVLACPRPSERDRELLLAANNIEVVEPAGLDPRQVAARILSVVLPRTCSETSFCGIVAVSCCMRELFSSVRKIAPLSDPVLIVGETGVGKELVARALHTTGRGHYPWVALNIAASTEQMIGSDLFGHVAGAFTGADRTRAGLLAEAGEGSILLDEIGDLDPSSQIKLLRLIEDRSYRPLGSNKEQPLRARVILATHKDLDRLVEEGTFRQDLYERIRGLELRVPPLRERMEDLPVLAQYLLDQLRLEDPNSSRRTITTMALDLLFRSAWPGNVRELRASLRRAATFSSATDGSLSVSVLRDCVRKRRLASRDVDGVSFDPEREFLAEAEARLRRAYLIRAMELSSNKAAIAAKLSGLSRARFYELLKDLGIQ